MFKRIETGFDGLYVLEPQVFNDERGYFFESYHARKLSELNIDTVFIQDNESKSVKGVIRGLHFQLKPFAQTKLVRVVSGEIIDVALDLRRNSPTFGKYYAVELSCTNKRQLYIPHGFAHGFSVLSEVVILNYKCDNFYSKEHERSINPTDSKLNINWKINQNEQIISDKDRFAPAFDPQELYF